MMDFKGIIFDFNGTLFSDSIMHFQAWDKMFLKYKGKVLNEDEKEQYLIGKYNESVIEILFHKNLSKEESDFYSKEKEAIYREICKAKPEGCHLVDGAEVLFDKLIKEGIPFTIASASIKDNMDFFIEEFHLDHWIKREHILYDDGTSHKKSDMYIKAAKLLEVDMDDILIFDDSASGIKGCQEAGCKKIVAVCDNAEKDKMLKLDGIVDTIENYYEFLEKYF